MEKKNIHSIMQVLELMTNNGAFSKNDAEEFLKHFLNSITEALQLGESVKIKGFGTFRLYWIEAWETTDEYTGKEIIVPGYYNVDFIPESEIALAINEPFAHLDPITLQIEEKLSNEKEVAFDENEITPIETLEKNSFSAQVNEIRELLIELKALKSEVSTQEEEEEKEEKIVAQEIIETPVEISEEEVEVEEVEEVEEILPIEEIESIEETTDKDLIVGKVEKEVTISSPTDDIIDDDFDVVRFVSEIYRESEKEIEEEISEPQFIASPEVEMDEETESDFVQEEEKTEKVEVEHKQIEEEISEPQFIASPEVEMDEETESDFVQEEEKTEKIEVEQEQIEEEIPEPQFIVSPEVEIDEETESDFVQEEEETEDVEVEQEQIEVEISEPQFIASPEVEMDEEDEGFKLIDRSVPIEPIPVRKKKFPIAYVVTLSFVSIIGLLLGFSVPFFLKIKNDKKKNIRLEYLADSIANKKEILRIKSVLGDEDSDSVDFENHQDSVTLILEEKSEQQAEKPKPTNNIDNNTDIYKAKREYSSFIGTEKMTVGTKLTSFARKYYGNPHYWVYIYEANKDKIKNPNNVPTGIDIKIPKMSAELVNPNNTKSIEFAKKLQSEYLK